MVEPFVLKDCALTAIATGKQAQNLRELRDRLEAIHPGCIYHHFWGGLMQARFDDPEYPNDFAAWAWRSLHDAYLAERLSLVDPTHFKSLEDLRSELIEVIEERLDEIEYIAWSKASQRFHFIRSQIVLFDTGMRVKEPEEFLRIVPQMPLGSIFYHFIDARARTPDGINDFSRWLLGFGIEYSNLAEHLAAIDPYFSTLTELRTELALTFNVYGSGR